MTRSYIVAYSIPAAETRAAAIRLLAGTTHLFFAYQDIISSALASPNRDVPDDSVYSIYRDSASRPLRRRTPP